MTNEEVATILLRIAALMELRDDNWSRVQAYRNAAEMIQDLSVPLAGIYQTGGPVALRDLPGIGSAISQRISEILDTGTCRYYEDLKAEIPETTLDLLLVEGVGIKTAQILFRQFKITNLADFASFVRGGGLQSVMRLGEKSQARIRTSLFGLVE